MVRHLHPAQRVTLRGVEPGGYDDEVGIERFGNRVDDEVKSGEIIGVAEPLLRPRHVDVVPNTLPGSRLLHRARLRIETVAVPVQGDVHHAVVPVEHVLYPVAVVHVPVQQQHPVHVRVRRERGARGDGRVVVETESHRPRALRVVTRRPDHREGSVMRPASHRVSRRARAPSRGPRASLGVLGPVDVAHPLHLLVARAVERVGDVLEVFARVTGQQFLVRRLPRGDEIAFFLEPVFSHSSHSHRVPRGPLEVVAGSLVQLHDVAVAQADDADVIALANRARGRFSPSPPGRRILD